MIMTKNSNKVPAIKSFNAIIILTLLISNGIVHCNDSNNLNNLNILNSIETSSPTQQQQQQSSHISTTAGPPRRVSGSGGGQLEKQRSSYAVISKAFSDTVNNEFGSKLNLDHGKNENSLQFLLKCFAVANASRKDSLMSKQKHSRGCEYIDIDCIRSLVLWC